MSFWAAAQLQPQRDGLALHCLHQAGFDTYAPRLRERRAVHGRAVVRTPLIFPGYCFVLIELQWRAAQKSPGIVRLVMNGTAPAAVPDPVISALKAREGADGLIELPKPPRFHPGDRVRVTAGAFAGHVGLYDGMRSHERVAVLLALLGGSQRVTLADDAVERVAP